MGKRSPGQAATVGPTVAMAGDPGEASRAAIGGDSGGRWPRSTPTRVGDLIPSPVMRVCCPRPTRQLRKAHASKETAMRTEIQHIREPALDEIQEPKYGWKTVHVFWQDNR